MTYRVDVTTVFLRHLSEGFNDINSGTAHVFKKKKKLGNENQENI